MTSPNSPKHPKRKSVTPDIMLDTNTYIIVRLLQYHYVFKLLSLGYLIPGWSLLRIPWKPWIYLQYVIKLLMQKEAGLIKRENNCKRDFYKTFLSLPCFIFWNNSKKKFTFSSMLKWEEKAFYSMRGLASISTFMS